MKAAAELRWVTSSLLRSGRILLDECMDLKWEAAELLNRLPKEERKSKQASMETIELSFYDGYSDVEDALQWSGTREDLPKDLRNASKEDIEEYLMDKYDGRKEFPEYEDWQMDCPPAGCEVEPFEFTPEDGKIEYWCRHYIDLFGELDIEDGVIVNERTDTGEKSYCVEEGVFWGKGA